MGGALPQFATKVICCAYESRTSSFPPRARRPDFQRRSMREDARQWRLTRLGAPAATTS
jgi:hypothetical protein